MPELAKLVSIPPGQKAGGAGSRSLTVQFNPETLRISYANENTGGKQPKGNATQFLGSRTSRLSVELLFDTTETNKDVREITEKLAAFLNIDQRQQKKTKNQQVPPGISFQWGTFIFEGVLQSMDETLSYFAEEGIPLRATMSLTLASQDVKFTFGQAGKAEAEPAAPAGLPPGVPLTLARQGDSVQQMAGRSGNSSAWKQIAAANGIDDPLRPATGQLLNMNPATRGRVA